MSAEDICKPEETPIYTEFPGRISEKETTLKCPKCNWEMVYSNNHWTCMSCNEEIED